MRHLDSEYTVIVSSAKMPNSCWGRYVHVAVIEHAPGTTVRQISTRPRAVRAIRAAWYNCCVGKTARAANSRAIRAAEQLANKLRLAQIQACLDAAEAAEINRLG